MKLLNHVKGLQFTELPGKHNCCGFGGTFSVKMTAISEQMVDEKVQQVDEKVQHAEETDADVLIGADCGCLMNIGGEYRRANRSEREADESFAYCRSFKL